MVIERSFSKACTVSLIVLAVLATGQVKPTQSQIGAASPDAGTYHATADPNNPADLPAQGSIIGWGKQRIDSVPLARIIAIAAGWEHSLALKADGSIVGWGSNLYGLATPPDGNDFVAIAAGEYHSLALRADGSIVAWGSNAHGMATPPVGNDFIAIAAGGGHSLAIRRQ